MTKKKSESITGIGPKPENKLVVQKSNPMTVLARSNLSLSELKILDMYLARIDTHKPEQRTVKLTKGQLEKALGISQIKKSDLTQRLKNLYQPIDLAKEDKKRLHLISLFEEAEASQDDYGVWQITLTCTQASMKYIFCVEDYGYFRYKLNSIISLASRYSMLLFVYLEKNRFRKEWEVPLAMLKYELNCDNDELYNEFKMFNQRILKKCQSELQKKTECRFTYEPVRRGRKVSAIKFTLEPLPKEYEVPEQLELSEFAEEEPAFDVSQSEAERHELYRDALSPYAITDEQIDELVQLARKHIDARGHFTGSSLDQQVYNYLLSAKRHAKINARSEIKNIYRYLLPIIKNNDIGW